MLLSLPPPGLLFYHEIADEQRIDAGRVKAADRIDALFVGNFVVEK